MYMLALVEQDRAYGCEGNDRRRLLEAPVRIMERPQAPARRCDGLDDDGNERVREENVSAWLPQLGSQQHMRATVFKATGSIDGASLAARCKTPGQLEPREEQVPAYSWSGQGIVRPAQARQRKLGVWSARPSPF
jgi:hypothetical protein